MKAAVYRRYGPPDVLAIEDVATPVPKGNEVLVRVHTSTVCAGDVRLRKADPFFLRAFSGWSGPTRIPILGMEFAGTIEVAGSGVTRFTKGDAVFGSMGLKFGANAEYVCVPEGGALAAKPRNANFAEAAAICFGGVSALHFLRLAAVGPGQRVLVYGASGSVGTYAVQLAKHFGAHVTGVCSASNAALVASLGADEVLDYARQDFSTARAFYDVVFDTVGKSGYWRSLRALKRGGAFTFAVSSLLAPSVGRLWARAKGRRIVSGIARGRPGDLDLLKELIESGQMRPVIDQVYPLKEIAQAHRHVDTGHKKGNIVITIREA